MRLPSAFAIAMLAWIGAAAAQTPTQVVPGTFGTDSDGRQVFQPNSVTNPLPVTATFSGSVTAAPAPSTTGTTTTNVTCGTSSTAFGVTGTTYLSVSVDSNATQAVCFGWGADPAVTTRQCFSGPAILSWGGGTGSCRVASGTQVVSVVTK